MRTVRCVIGLTKRYCSKSPAGSTTHFGFDEVPEHVKQEKVYQVFDRVAERYDVMNDAMSFGLHRLWKDRLVFDLDPSPKMKILDVAGGTGDIAFRCTKYMRIKNFGEKPEAPVTVCDINKHMIEVGKRRAVKLGLDESEIAWVEGNAEKLPFEDNEFDAYTIAFGIRNCTHIDKVLDEAHRVLRPGGRFLCLELCPLQSPTFSRLYDFYSFQILPVMGTILAADWKSYQYLAESIRRFPDQETFKTFITSAGFSKVRYHNLANGVLALHSGFKLS